MSLGNTPRNPRISLRSSHRTMRLGVSHRDVPSAWNAPSKDRDDRGPARPDPKRKGR